MSGAEDLDIPYWEPPPSMEVIDTGLQRPVGFIVFPEKRAPEPPVAESGGIWGIPLRWMFNARTCKLDGCRAEVPTAGDGRCAICRLRL